MCVCLINGEIKMVMGLNGGRLGGWGGGLSLVDDGMGVMRVTGVTD